MNIRSKACLNTAFAAVLLLTASCSSGTDGTVKKLNRNSATKMLTERYSSADGEDIKMVFSEGPTFAEITIDDRADMALLESDFAHVKQIPLPRYSDRVCLYLTEAGRARSEQWEEMESERESEATEDCPYDASWIIPLGSLESIEVTGIQNLSDTSAKVEFDLEYNPNEMGKILQEEGLDNPIQFSSASINLWEDTLSRTASLELYDDGWRIKDID